ncbi:HAD hydrolase family protein [bacterium]|nr:HAD hydrolase family protein [bacterium]
MNQRLLIAVDMDGTLVNTEAEDRLRDREIAALEAVREAGHVVAICTGRNRPSLDSLLDRSGWHPSDLPKVMLNGAVVDGGVDHGVLAHNVVPRPVIARLVQLFRDHGTLPMVYGADHDGGELLFQQGDVNPILQRYLDHRRDRVGAMTWHGELADALPEAALEVGTIDRRELIEPLTAAIRAELADTVRVINTRSLLGEGRYFWAEVYHHACSKGTGVERIAATVSPGPTAVIAIGDNYNDLDMFAVADVAVAMPGGPADVQAQADRIAPAVEQSGAAVILEQIAAGDFACPAGSDEETA